MNARILNRNSEPPADGWYQIEVNGTWPAGKNAEGQPRRQLIDDKAINSIVNRFNAERDAAGEHFPGLLVDLDHLSHDLTRTTEAYAWCQELEIRNGQLHGRLDLTDLGDPAIRNKRVKFFSTEYDPEDLETVDEHTVRPLRLAGLAFTNRPNNRGGKPISNRDGDEPGGEPKPKPTETNTTMKSIAETLGLPADADEAAIQTKLTSILSELEELKAKQSGAEADAVMNRFGDRVPESSRKKWRERLIANRADTEALMEDSFPEKNGKEGQKRIFNRSEATAPEPVRDTDDTESKQKAAAIRNRAASISKAEGIPFNQAFSRAQAELS